MNGRPASERSVAGGGSGGPASHRPRVATLALAGALLLAVVATYANHFDNTFHFDDNHVIVDNAYLRDLSHVPLFFTEPETASTLPTNRGYRPLLLTTYAIDYALGDGLDPVVFHTTTFVLFLLQGGLMFLLYRWVADRSLPDPRNDVVALLLTAWYLLHPANAETINYVTARSDSLSTLLVVAGLVIDQRARSRVRHLAWVPPLLGLFVKPTAAMFVPLLWIQRLLFEERIGGRDLATMEGLRAAGRQARAILAGAVVMAGAFAFTMMMTPESWVAGGTSPVRYLWTQPFVLLRYVAMFFLPIDLSADTDWGLLPTAADSRLVAGVAFVIVAIGSAWWASNHPRTRPVAYGILWFFIALAPSSSVIPLSEVTNDHRMFFPFVGFVLAVGWAITLLVHRYGSELGRSRALRAGGIAAVLLVVGGYAWGTRARNEVWATDATLWRDVTLKSPNNGRGLMNYGLVLMRQGDYRGANSYFERALETDYGNHPYVYVNLAIARNALGRPEEAGRLFEEALERSRGFPAVHYFYARWLHEQGRDEEAVPHLDWVLEQSPGDEAARALREAIAGALDPDAAVEQAWREAASAPSPDRYLELSLRLFRAGRYGESVEAAREALALQPDYAPAYNNICAAYNALHRWDEAIEACRAAVEIQPDYPLARNNLQWALDQREAEAGSP